MAGGGPGPAGSRSGAQSQGAGTVSSTRPMAGAAWTPGVLQEDQPGASAAAALAGTGAQGLVGHPCSCAAPRCSEERRAACDAESCRHLSHQTQHCALSPPPHSDCAQIPAFPPPPCRGEGLREGAGCGVHVARRLGDSDRVGVHRPADFMPGVQSCSQLVRGPPPPCPGPGTGPAAPCGLRLQISVWWSTCPGEGFDHHITTSPYSVE